MNLRGVSTKLNKYIIFTMQTYKKLIRGVYVIVLASLFINEVHVNLERKLH